MPRFIEYCSASFCLDLRGEEPTEPPEVVFLHAGVADRRMWQTQLAALAAARSVAAYDRRGFGETQTADVDFSHVEDLRALLDHLGVERVCLVGCSQGARISIDFALTWPERVRGLVLISPAVSGESGDKFDHPPQVLELLERLEAAEAVEDLELVNAIEAHAWLDGPQSDEGRVTGADRALFLDMNGIALRAPLLSGETQPAPALVRATVLTMPALVVSGELDFPHVIDVARRLAAALPDAELVMVRESAHLLNLEMPDFVNSLIGRFLAQLPD